VKKDRKHLRTGFTTGSSAAAAAGACLEALMRGHPPERITIDLPQGGTLIIPVHAFESRNGHLIATVQKDAGDDPDITDKAIIGAIVTPHERPDTPRIHIKGGHGVGKVTRPGLPVKVGEDAINPVPRSMILHEVSRRLPEEVGHIDVEIFIKEGEELAQKTLNPRLGIVGGLSVLGTTGIVKPFSAESYRETIRICVEGIRREGHDTVVFSTGGKSERLAREAHPELPEIAFVQIADFLGYALRKAKEEGLRRALLSCFFGKLCKWALGGDYTHAHTQTMDFGELATIAASVGLSPEFCRFVASANTARQIAESTLPETEAFMRIIGDLALQLIRNRLGSRAEVTILCWRFDGKGAMTWPE
jgi:cobalt-precorrin-5B (C1)-methyltransferase